MADIIQNGAVSIYQDIELSLTEHLVPPVVHVKQFDHKARKVRCTLYANAVEYTIPTNIILAYSGTRPDGRLFQYSTEKQQKSLQIPHGPDIRSYAGSLRALHMTGRRK